MTWRPFVLAFAAMAAASGCGPSVQSIYEGSVRFEHCYRLDLEQDVATSHRQACWTSWLERYTYGQSRDRLEYARRRVRGFTTGDVDRPVLRVGQAQDDSRQFYLVVPAPTSVHASPPPIATRTHVVAEAPKPAPDDASKPAPADDCATACKAAFSSCNQACDPATPSAACKSCDPDYKKCMQRCFE